VSTVAVIGAAGIIGPAIVATLAEHDAVDEIRCLDRDGDGARTVAKRHGMAQTGLRNLAGIFLGFRVPKGAKTTNWAAARLISCVRSPSL